MKYLRFLSGPNKGESVRLDREVVTIGRDHTNDLPLDDLNSSRHHAEIYLRGGVYRIRDLDSTNSTVVNGEAIRETALSMGDQIMIGDTLLVIEERGKSTTHAVTFHEGEPGEESRQLRLDPTQTHYLDPSAVLTQPAAVQRLARLYQFISSIVPILTTDRLLSEIFDLVFQTVPADRAFTMLVDDEGRLRPARMRCRDPGVASEDIKVSRRMSEQVLQSGQSVFSSDTLRDVRFKDTVAFKGTRVSSFVCAPLKSHDRVLGLLYADTVGLTSPLAEEDFQFLTALALLAGSQIANAKLYGDVLDSMQYTQSILRCLRSGVVVTDLGGKVRQVNESACEFLRLRKDELVGRTFSDFGTLRSLWQVMDETKSSGVPADSKDIVITVAGENVPFGVTTSFLRDHENHLRGIVASFRNLSMLNKLSNQLEMAQHLAAIGQMSAQVAHEIRNPLNSIRGFAQLLEEILPEASDAARREKGASYLKIIIEEVDRMNQIVQDLLDFSRQQELTMIETDCAELVEDVLREMEPVIAENAVQVETRIASDVPPVMANSAKIKQVLVNIVRNAIQAMTPPVAPETAPRRLVASVGLVAGIQSGTGGPPGRGGAGGKLPGKGEAGPEARAAAVEMVISDTGVGMDKTTRARIFEPFFTTRERGTGLGLAICRKIAKQHRGEIAVKSLPGGGSAFRIRLPVS